MSFLNSANAPAPEKSFDIECYRLANHFLDEFPHATGDNHRDLAATIQQAVEDWLEDQFNAAESAHDAYIDRRIDERRMGRDA